jgi:hypothetical protein
VLHHLLRRAPFRALLDSRLRLRLALLHSAFNLRLRALHLWPLRLRLFLTTSSYAFTLRRGWRRPGLTLTLHFALSLPLRLLSLLLRLTSGLPLISFLLPLLLL